MNATRLPKHLRRSVITMVKLRPDERRSLDRASQRRRKAGLPNWSRASILREALAEWLVREDAAA